MVAENFTVIAVALDENVAAVIPFADGITYPVLVDTEHQMSEIYAISNVPTVGWIDEDDRIVRPNAQEPGSDMFTEFTGIKCEGHMEQVRSWIRGGVLPVDAAYEVEALDEAEVAAHLHFRLAVHARRSGMDKATKRHFALAAESAPNDFTIVRGAMPLTEVDPFGPAFFELYGRFSEAGSPYHGIRRTSG